MGHAHQKSYIEPIISILKDGKLDATDIITHTLPLDEGKTGYTIFDTKDDGCIKVVLKP